MAHVWHKWFTRNGLRLLRHNPNEGLGITENLTVDPRVPVTGGTTFGVHDQFSTRNRFYGGEIGARAELWSGNLFVNVRGMVALGSTDQVVDLAGSTATPRSTEEPNTASTFCRRRKSSSRWTIRSPNRSWKRFAMWPERERPAMARSGSWIWSRRCGFGPGKPGPTPYRFSNLSGTQKLWVTQR